MKFSLLRSSPECSPTDAEGFCHGSYPRGSMQDSPCSPNGRVGTECSSCSSNKTTEGAAGPADDVDCSLGPWFSWFPQQHGRFPLLLSLHENISWMVGYFIPIIRKKRGYFYLL